MSTRTALLSIRLSADYAGKRDVLKDVALEVYPGEILGLVGQSGSGKSTMALAVLGLLGVRGGAVRGEIMFGGRNLVRATERDLRSVRGRELSLVLQSPMTSLNPALRIGTQLHEAWRAHARSSRREAVAHILDTLESVNLPVQESFLRRYPAQLSVGQAQRVLIAMAILHRPRLLVADEPTSALDAITSAEVLKLFARLSRELRMSILFISHDLMSVASLCHRVAILDQGQIVECGITERVFRSPEHPYTRRLINALPRLQPAPDQPSGSGFPVGIPAPAHLY